MGAVNIMRLSWKECFIVCLLSKFSNSENEITERQKKMFSLFTIVQFPNDECSATSDSTVKGTCFTTTECASKSGSSDGNCAAGFGVCCIFTLSTCGTTATQNCTYIQNPSYPTTYSTSGNCIFTITPVSANICQLRLDFDNFDITDASTGECTDSLTIGGQSGLNPMDLCGTNTNMHLYVENARSTTGTTLTFSIASTDGGTWKIKTSQIECSNYGRANPDCEQWFTGVSGTVQSFNFATVMLQAKRFGACIRREYGYCGIQYSEAITTPDSFLLDDAIASKNANGDLTTTVHGWIVIPNGPLADIYSGAILAENVDDDETVSASVTVTNHLYRIDHATIAATTAAVTGFKLSYIQIPCASAGYR